MKPINNQGGQAIIEYVLLLIVTVGLISLAGKLFTPLGQFMNSYMGDYVVCLMEYGELPKMGSTNTAINTHDGSGGGRQCKPGFKKIDPSAFARAGGGAGSNSNANGGKNGNNKAGNNGRDTSANKDGNSNSSEDLKSGGRNNSNNNSGNSASASTSSGKPGVSSDSQFGTADGPSASGGNSKVKVIEEDENGANNRNRNASNANSSRRSSNRNAYHGISGRMAEEIEKSIKVSKRTPSSRKVAAADEGYRMKLYKKTFTPPVFKSELAEEKSEGFGFGNLIKWLFIIGMILAIVVLLGGQVLNYSNSKDQ